MRFWFPIYVNIAMVATASMTSTMCSEIGDREGLTSGPDSSEDPDRATTPSGLRRQRMI